MNIPKICAILFLLLITGTFSSCEKFLSTKSNQTLSTPATISDLQQLLDNPSLQFGLNSINTGGDEYYITYANWLNLQDVNKRGYAWDPELNSRNDWYNAYEGVFFANTVLFNLDIIPERGTEEMRNHIKGAALFIRAHYFYLIAQQFAPQYDKTTASADLGIVLRLNPDFNEASVRSSVEQTYQQILSDLEQAAKLLPDMPLFKGRPGKAACLFLLARTYLQMGNFAKAKENAAACLQINNELIDYNSLTSTATYPLGDYNKNGEIIYYFRSSSTTPVAGDESRARVDSNLYRSYEPDDLRKKVFFRNNGNGTFTFKGNYTGVTALFNGFAVDEAYLIKAECAARMNNAAEALEDINTLLRKRWTTGKFIPYKDLSPDQALGLVLQERKKELLYRGSRWIDLKRLNKESRFASTIKRDLNGIVELPPNDLRYAILIPIEIINVTNLPQNPR